MSALEVGKLRRPGLTMVGGVPGLGLLIGDEPSSRSWILRFSLHGSRRDKGLGPFPEVSLATARQKAKEGRALVREGVDPILSAKAAKSRAIAARAASRTFAQCAELYVESKQAEWKNAKHVWQWISSLRDVAGPVLGNMPVSEIELPHVLAVLEPIWKTTTESATRLRGRIELVLDWATVRGYRTGANPARWKGHLEAVLPAPGKIAKVKHYASLPVDQVPPFMEQLRAVDGVSARALEFAILTAARSREVRLAVWSEVDLTKALWTAPAEHMKASKEHVVPLSKAAMDVLRAMPRGDPDAPIFQNRNTGKPLSDMAMVKVVRDLGAACVPHGFRSSFRVWCAERTLVAEPVAEAALAHAIPNAVTAAYQRSDLLDKRAPLMAQWGKFCSEPLAAATVTPINSKRRTTPRASG